MLGAARARPGRGRRWSASCELLLMSRQRRSGELDMTASNCTASPRCSTPGRPDEVTALTGVDLTVERGEFVSLIGPSGCGKSTLLRLVADLIQPTSGTVTVAGKPAGQARLDQEYGIAFQQAGLFEWRTRAAQRRASAGAARDRPARAAGRGREEMLGLVGLSDFAGHYPAQLSGGMQQRVAIARALAVHPPLLLMDEPFGALDEMTRERLQDELLRICGRTGTSTIFVTHSISEAVYLSDRVVVMSARPGRITAEVDIDLGRRGEPTRQSAGFFAGITRCARRCAASPPPRRSRHDRILRKNAGRGDQQTRILAGNCGKGGAGSSVPLCRRCWSAWRSLALWELIVKAGRIAAVHPAGAVGHLGPAGRRNRDVVWQVSWPAAPTRSSGLIAGAAVAVLAAMVCQPVRAARRGVGAAGRGPQRAADHRARARSSTTCSSRPAACPGGWWSASWCSSRSSSTPCADCARSTRCTAS